jgi:electron transfer flavoprotein alpha subunit
MRIIILAQHTVQAQALADAARALTATAEVVALSAEVKDNVLADLVYDIVIPEGYMLEDAAETVSELLAEEKPTYVFCEPTRQMKLLAGKVAARLGVTVIGDIMSLTDEGAIEHLVYGGAAIKSEKSSTPITLLMVPDNVLPQKRVSSTCSTRVIEFKAPAVRPQLKETAPQKKVSVNLSGATRVVGVGRGIAEEKDMEMVRAFASALGAEVGCTRPIAEEEKWLPREVYIGVSGMMIAPDVYVAIGLSGQVQHTVGINRAKTIIAINKEKNAPIFKQADFGIVGDLYKIVPALTELLA